MTTPTPAPPAAVELVWETPEDRVAILSVGEVTVTLTADELADLISDAEHVHDLLTCDLAEHVAADRSEQAHEAAVDAALLGEG